MSAGRVAFVVLYFGGLGYAVAKSGLDRKVAKGIKAGYTELVKYTREVSGPTSVHITLENVGVPAAIGDEAHNGDTS